MLTKDCKRVLSILAKNTPKQPKYGYPVDYIASLAKIDTVSADRIAKHLEKEGFLESTEYRLPPYQNIPFYHYFITEKGIAYAQSPRAILEYISTNWMGLSGFLLQLFDFIKSFFHG